MGPQIFTPAAESSIWHAAALERERGRALDRDAGLALDRHALALDLERLVALSAALPVDSFVQSALTSPRRCRVISTVERRRRP